MKPSISVDERGVLLHLVDADGKGFAVALNQQTVAELGAQCAAAVERLQSPEQRGRIIWRLARAAVREIFQLESHGTPDPDTQRKTDR